MRRTEPGSCSSRRGPREPRQARPAQLQCCARVRRASASSAAELLVAHRLFVVPTTGGFASMRPPFTIQRVPRSDKLPSASTCFNLLKLPDYSDSATTLPTKLRLSVVEGTTGFAFS